MTVRPTPAALLAAALLLLPAALTAQEPVRSRFSGTLSLLNIQPLGELRTGPGIGLAASGAFALDPAQRLRLRADVRLASYGHESRRFCISQTIGCWIEVDVNTDYTMMYGGVGPELALPILGTELVLDATAGVGYFGVASSLQGIDDADDRIGHTTHYDDTVFAWSAGGDLRIPDSRVLAVSLGTHYLHNGQASYVVEGGITQNPDGTLDVHPLTTDANVVAITLGVAIHPRLGGDGLR